MNQQNNGWHFLKNRNFVSWLKHQFNSRAFNHELSDPKKSFNSSSKMIFMSKSMNDDILLEKLIR